MKKITKLKYYHFADSNEVKELSIECLQLLISQKNPTHGLLLKEHTTNYILPKQIRCEGYQSLGHIAGKTAVEEHAKWHPDFATGKIQTVRNS